MVGGHACELGSRQTNSSCRDASTSTMGHIPPNSATPLDIELFRALEWVF